MLLIAICNLMRFALLKNQQNDNRFITTSTGRESGYTAKPPLVVAKTLRVMQLTAALLLIFSLSLSAHSVSQTVSISGKNLSFETIFQKIKIQTGYSVITDLEVFDKSAKVSIAAENMDISLFLEKILHQSSFGFEIRSKTIFIKEKQRQNIVEQLMQATSTLPITIRGHVINERGESIIAAVVIKGTRKGGLTDEQGNFLLKEVDAAAILIISAAGYEATEIRVNGRNEINVVLRLSTSPLDEVQVIAYGSNTQRFNVGSVATITAEEIKQQPVTNPLLALQGRVAGLAVTPSNGVPGATINLQIRGMNRLNGLYDQPLYIIDGVPFAPQNARASRFNSLDAGATNVILPLSQASYGISPFNNINPLDIESITILKDADATSIYGSQGSNGVVLITTKKAKAGKTSFDLSVQTGPNKVSRNIEMMNVEQYLNMQRQALINDGDVWPFLPDVVPVFNPSLSLFDPNKNTNWFKQFYGNTAGNTIVHGSLSGGSARTGFVISAGMSRQEYNFPGDFLNKTYTLHTGLNHASSNNKLKIDLGIDYSYNENNSSGEPSVLQAFTLPPNFPDMLDENKQLVWLYKGFDLESNPYAYLYRPASVQFNNIKAHLNINYKILPGLEAGIVTGLSRMTSEEYTAIPKRTLNPLQSAVSSAGFGTSNFEIINTTPSIKYVSRIVGGELSLLVGGEYKQSVISNRQVSGENYANDALLRSINGAQTIYTTDNYSKYKYAGVFGRVGYNLLDRYLLNFTIRRDGSSNFGPGKQFGTFGSIAGGWIFSEATSFKNSIPFISYGKITASYGTQGGDGIMPYQYQSNWLSRGAYYSFQGIVSYQPVNLFNSDYSWDVNKKTNIGLSLAFFKDRLIADFTVYQNLCSNQLISYALPVQTGFGSVVTNQPATVRNRGWEIVLSSTNINTDDFKWNSYFNISANVNKLIAFPHLEKSSYAERYAIGEPTTLVYGYRYLGVNPATGIFQFLSANGEPTSAPVNGRSNSLVRPGDMYPVANMAPKFFGGLSNSFSWRGFNLTALFQFVKQTGINFMGALYADVSPGKNGINQPALLLEDIWQEPGDLSRFQKLSSGMNAAVGTAASAFARSSGAFSDASYIKLKNVSLSWNIPQPYISKIGMRGASVFINAQNLFVLTPYELVDPEIAGQLYGFPLQKTIVAGFTLNF